MPGPEPACATAPVAKRPTVLLYVGRLSREKRLDVLIDAWNVLAGRNGRDYRLWIVGEGPERARIERQAGGDPRIRLFGLCPYGEALARIYAATDVFVLPSPNETFGLTILEALASGVPVVAVRQGGPSNLVRAGVGELAEPGNALDLALKVEKLSGERPRADLCRGYVEEGYSWDRTFDRLLDVYERAVAARRVSAGAGPAARAPAAAAVLL